MYDWIEHGDGNAVVNAVAGSGKTTTLVQAANLIAPGDLLFLAFNRAIVEELRRRLPREANVSTLNSLGHRALSAHLGRSLCPDQYKYRQIITDMLDAGELGYTGRRVQASVTKAVLELVSFAQSTLSDLTDEALDAMAGHYAIDMDIEQVPDKEKITPVILYGLTRKVLREGEDQAEEGVISFDDQIWLPWKWKLRPPRARFVFIDECQDLSAAKLELALSACSQDGRILAVGDPRQAIYGFTGADSNAFDAIAARTNATVLPLSVSYRCPVTVVLEAKMIVPDIEHAEYASCGVVDEIEQRQMIGMLDIGDLVLCRLTAPLVRLCIDLIRRRIPARVAGRDIGKSLTTIAKDALGHRDWSEFGDCLRDYHDRKAEKLKQRKHPENQLQSLADKVDGVRVCYEEFSVKSLQEFNDEIEVLFSDDKGLISLSTIHRAKGLEAPHVFIICPEKLPLTWPGQLDWQLTQEQNLRYVAVTRSQDTLYYVRTPGAKVTPTPAA